MPVAQTRLMQRRAGTRRRCYSALPDRLAFPLPPSRSPPQRSDGDRRRIDLAAMIVQVAMVPGETPSQISILEALGAVRGLHQRKRFPQAWALVEVLINDGRARTEAQLLKLALCLDMARPQEGLVLARALLDCMIEKAPDLWLLSKALRTYGQHDQALLVVTAAIDRFPGDPNLHELRAMVFLDVDDRLQALTDLREVIRLDPGRSRPYLSISGFMDLSGPELRGLDAIDARGGSSSDVGFCRANLARRRGDQAAEFRHLDQAHANVRRAAKPWNAAAQSAHFEQLIGLFDGPAAPAPMHGQQGAGPIFVVGMPRSGSTLIESILLSDPSVGTAGETLLFEAVLNQAPAMRQTTLPRLEAMATLAAEDLTRIGAAYQAAIIDMHTPQVSFVDKKLENFLFIGLLARAFPDARFVHAVRHPLGAILSCYQQHLIEVPFAHSLTDLALWYELQRKLTDHWKVMLPGRIHTVAYESMVMNPDTEARALMEFCGLAWRDDVLDFHRSSRSVRTASVFQVRQPIHAASAKRWKDYERWLGPAKQALGMD